MICQKKPITEESNQATSGSTVFIRWGRSECPADRGTVLVYEGTLVHIYFDYCSNLQNHTDLKGLCIEDIDVLAPEGLLGLIFCWVCAAGLSQPLPHYSLLCGQL